MRDAPVPTNERPVGWWNPEPTRSQSRYHYVGADGISLCGKWWYRRGRIEPEDGPSPDDCRACRKKLDAISKAAILTPQGAPDDKA